MTIQKRSLISTLSTTKKAIVASTPVAPASGEVHTNTLRTNAKRTNAKRTNAKRTNAKRTNARKA